MHVLEYSEDREIAYDRRREVFLKAEGCQIVRVQNDDVYEHMKEGFSAGGNTAALRFAALIRRFGHPGSSPGQALLPERAREKRNERVSRFNLIGMRSSLHGLIGREPSALAPDGRALSA